MTSRETLMRDSNSMLARLVSDSELISDKVRMNNRRNLIASRPTS